MSGSREKDQSDFDLEQFINLFDTALSSDNPAVKRAMNNLLMVAALVDSNAALEPRNVGPLRRLVDDFQNLSRRVSALETFSNKPPFRADHVYPQLEHPDANTWQYKAFGPGTI